MFEFLYDPIRICFLIMTFSWMVLCLSVNRGVQRLRNSFLLMFSLCCTAVYIASLFGDKMLTALYQICLLIGIVLLFVPVILISNGFIMYFREKHSLANALSIILGIAIAIGEAAFITAMLGNEVLIMHKRINRLLAIVGLSAFYFSFLMLAFVFYSIFVHIIPRKRQFDYIIIAGCGLRADGTPGKLLQNRLNKAITVYRSSGPDTILIPSGGQGPDEIISEGESMAQYLVAHGVPENRILPEKNSFSTRENLARSAELIGSAYEKKKIAVVSSNYHIYRLLMYAKELHMHATGIGAHVALYYWPSALIRECIAVYSDKSKFIPTLAVWIFLLILVFVA